MSISIYLKIIACWNGVISLKKIDLKLNEKKSFLNFILKKLFQILLNNLFANPIERYNKK